MIDDNNNI